ncbi:APC family permease [Calidifontibacter terrae]
MTAKQAEPVAQQPELRRNVGLIGLLFASVGSIIGSGWLFGAMNAAKLAGPAAMISWAIGMVMVLIIALVFSELGTMFPVSGGVVRFPHIAFGNFSSYTNGWILWIACATVAPIEVEAALQYATKYAAFTSEHTLSDGTSVHTLTTLGYISAVVLMGLFVLVNYLGVKWFEKINTTLVWWKLAIITVVIIAFLFSQFHTSNFTSGPGGFMPFGWEGVFTSIATSGIVFSFLGFRQGIELAGETDNPHRNVPITVIGSVLICGVLYIGLQIAFIGALNGGDFAKGWDQLNFADSFGPLAALSTALGLGWLAYLLYADAIISPGDTGLIYTTATSRVSYAMARNGNAPAALARTNKNGVPFVSLVVAFVVGLIVFLPFPSWQQLVGFITSATVLSFASGPVAAGALRRTKPDQHRPFRVPGGDLFPLLAFACSNLIVIWSTWTINYKLFITVLLGLVFLGISRATGHVQGSFEWRAGFWMVPWLVGLAIISWFAGDLDDKARLGFGLGALITVIFSVAIYYFAIHFRLPEERMDEHIDLITKEAAMEEVDV